MRFARQARIFRGQLDPAPFVAVLFLLVIFLQISSLIHTPGVLVHLNNPAATISVTPEGRVQFGTNLYSAAQMSQLRAALKDSPAGPPFDVRVERGAPPAVATQVSNLLGQLFQIQLPVSSTNLTVGTDNPTMVVAVNFLGQYFFENQIVGEKELKNRFKANLQAAARQSKELTLVVWADKQVDFGAVTRLEQWAAEAGIADVVQAQRAAAPAKPAP